MSSTFGFRASASALGGTFRHPFNEPLPVQAASVLPSVGGYGSARVENFRFHELVSFTAAYTQVSGVEYVNAAGDIERATLALAVVEGLNVLDMVTADRVVGRLVSESPTAMRAPGLARNSAAADAGRELGWLPAGSYFVNLRIGGHLIQPQPHKGLADRKTTLHSGRRAILDGAGAVTHDKVGQLTNATDPRLVQCSMFEDEHQFNIPGFGDVFLGEFVTAPSYRRLTMIRIAMGCPVGGDLSAASLEGNGIQY